MRRHFVDWEEFFTRPKNEYVKWLEDTQNEQLNMIITDLLGQKTGEMLVVEGIFNPEFIKRISSYNRVIFLYAEPGIVRKGYFDREDKQDVLRAISSTSNPEKALNNVLDVVSSENNLVKAKESGLKYLIRKPSTTKEELLYKVETHLGLIEI